MKRDIDLIRLILEHVESKTDTSSEPIAIENYSEDEINYNAQLLTSAGYLEAEVLGYGGVFVKSLTFEGHDFLDAARDKNVWKSAKEKILKHGGSFTMDLLKSVLVEIAKNKLIN
jgi:hypothetical protein